MSRIKEPVIDRWLLPAVLAVFLLFGGSARADSGGLLIVRVAAILAIGLAFPGWWAVRGRMAQIYRPLMLLLAAAAAVIVLQLIPLPPGLWSALPGHGDLADKMSAAGVPIGWRPLALVPGAAINALFALLVPLAVLLAVAITSDKSLRQLPLYLMIILGVAAAVGFLQSLAGPETGLYFHRITNRGAAVGFFANRNHHALFLALYWPLLIWFLHGRSDRAGSHAMTILGLFGGLAILLATIATGSRAGAAISTISFLAGTGALLWLRPRGAGTEAAEHIVRWLALVCLAAAALLAVVLVGFGSSFMDRIGEADVAEDIRFAVLPSLMELIRNFAPFGSGFGSFEAAYKIVEPVDLLRRNYLNHAHNDYVEVLIEGGILALALLGGWAWVVVRGARAGWRNEGSAATDKVAILALLAILLIFGAGSLFDYPLRTPALAALAMVATTLLFRRPDVPAVAGRRMKMRQTGPDA